MFSLTLETKSIWDSGMLAWAVYRRYRAVGRAASREGSSLSPVLSPEQPRKALQHTPVSIPQASELCAEQAHECRSQAAAGDQVFYHEGREQVNVES